MPLRVQPQESGERLSFDDFNGAPVGFVCAILTGLAVWGATDALGVAAAIGVAFFVVWALLGFWIRSLPRRARNARTRTRNAEAAASYELELNAATNEKLKSDARQQERARLLAAASNIRDSIPRIDRKRVFPRFISDVT
jgi:hypothetical protein